MLRRCGKRKSKHSHGFRKKRREDNAESFQKKKSKIDGAVECILSNLSIPDLHNCLTVSKSWYSLIKSDYFRRLWCSNSHARAGEEGLLVLTSNYAFGNNCDVWKPGVGVTSSIRLAGYTYSQVVASAGGLVCVLGKPEPDPDLEQLRSYKLAVGNPLTKEWVELPSLAVDHVLRMNMSSFIEFRMEVLEGTWSYRVTVQHSDETGYCGHMYDSLAGAWSPLPKILVDKSEAAAKKMAMYNIASRSWSMGWLGSSVVRTRKERGDDDLHVLSPHASTGSFCVWECEGVTYLAAPWMVACDGCVTDVDPFPGGFGVWRLVDGKLHTVSAVWQREMMRKAAGTDGDAYLGLTTVKTDACGYLACFSPYNEPEYPVVVYDLRTGEWHTVFQLKPSWSSCDRQLYFSRQLYFRKNYLGAVVYRPSLLSPLPK